MFRIWYSTEILARYIIDHTKLRKEENMGNLILKKMAESDANNSSTFHKMPTHLKKILYLDAPDIIVENNNKPILSLEISTEAGTGHNAFQRFSRISAALESEVPSFYIYPEACFIHRNNTNPGWDKLNPLVFEAMEKAMRIYNIPALLYFFPSYLHDSTATFPRGSKGLKYHSDYPSCPEHNSEMEDMFKSMDIILENSKNGSPQPSLMGERRIQNRRDIMVNEQYKRMQRQPDRKYSPLTATEIIPTKALLNYLRSKSSLQTNYDFGDMLPSREETLIYKVNAKFRGDPYPGAIAALDYLSCRKGKSFEERNLNLVIAWGEFNYDPQTEKITINGDDDKSVKKFVNSVKSTYHNEGKILLGRDFDSLSGREIPRYLMQVRFGSTFTKVKHIRVFSYFCDALLFHDGVLWREG